MDKLLEVLHIYSNKCNLKKKKREHFFKPRESGKLNDLQEKNKSCLGSPRTQEGVCGLELMSWRNRWAKVKGLPAGHTQGTVEAQAGCTLRRKRTTPKATAHEMDFELILEG